MDDKQTKLVIGGLLHDIGKILYKKNKEANHSESGYSFLKENGIVDEDILCQVRYHHQEALKASSQNSDSLAYIIYWADSVAVGSDSKKKKSETASYDEFVPLKSIFNNLNGNDEHYSYNLSKVWDDGSISNPKKENGKYDEETYCEIIKCIKENLEDYEISNSYVNSLLSTCEANLSFIPSSIAQGDLSDISLFDHMKITAAISSCIYEYMKNCGVSDYKNELLDNEEKYYDEKCFLIFSMDISGIQDFIYTVDSSGAMKSLRAKSFYLEIMLEHIIDELLFKLDVSRANLIYAGGGHAYLVLPNTDNVKAEIDKFEMELNNWYIKNFGTDLYIACGYTACTANDLMNKPEGAYKDMFLRVSESLSQKKSSRYTAEQLKQLNSNDSAGSERECRVCGRADQLTDDNICSFCDNIMAPFNGILHKPIITVLKSAPKDEESIKLPFDYYMVMEGQERFEKRLSNNTDFVRAYSKNKMLPGLKMTAKLWVGDYCSNSLFELLANRATGIERLGVLRADIDNLGQAFVSGFEKSGKGGEYVSISRTATFSRKLNMFFKLHINHILGNAKYSIDKKPRSNPQRSALIVYSGGDDLFIVGSWNEIVEAAFDINDALRKYSQRTLTISAGIAMFPKKYPVKAMALQTGDLEDASKGVDGKNAITLFTEEMGSYKWSYFKEHIVDKFKLINDYFESDQDKGMSAIYKLMEYIRNLDDRINLPRLAYMLGRMEPSNKNQYDEKVKAQWEKYRVFSRTIYNWVSGEQKEAERQELLIAFYLYVYLHREKEGNDGKTERT